MRKCHEPPPAEQRRERLLDDLLRGVAVAGEPDGKPDEP